MFLVLKQFGIHIDVILKQTNNFGFCCFIDLRSAGWTDLRHSVQTATRKAHLRRAEDPIDAVLCAYIARFASERPSDVTVYGEAETGCIVTPAQLRPEDQSRR